MFLSLDFESEVPIYQQIRLQVIQGIASRALAPGESLPSVRQLASEIGVNLHTVNKAYQILRDEGFVVIHRQRGVLIAEHPCPPDLAGYLDDLKSRFAQLVAEAKALGIKPDQIRKLFVEASGFRLQASDS